MNRPRIERRIGTTAVDLVIEAAALPPPGPDGRIRLAIDPLALLSLADEVQSAQRGLVLAVLYPAQTTSRPEVDRSECVV